MRVGWCDVCTDFINVIRVDVNVDEMSLCLTHAAFEKQSTALHVVGIIIFLSVCVYFVDKNEDRDQNYSFDLINFRR